jgi:hypothetical protein
MFSAEFEVLKPILIPVLGTYKIYLNKDVEYAI